MTPLPPRLERLHKVLKTLPPGYCLLYDIHPEWPTKLDFRGGFGGMSEARYRQYDAMIHATVLRCYEENRSGILGPESVAPPNDPNELGQQMWAFILASGPTRAGGNVLLIGVLAKDEPEVQQYAKKVQAAMNEG